MWKGICLRRSNFSCSALRSWRVMRPCVERGEEGRRKKQGEVENRGEERRKKREKGKKRGEMGNKRGKEGRRGGERKRKNRGVRVGGWGGGGGRGGERGEDNATSSLAHLCKKFLGTSTRLNIHKSIVSIFDHPMPKGTHAQLHQCPVVQNLGIVEQDFHTRKRKRYLHTYLNPRQGPSEYKRS